MGSAWKGIYGRRVRHTPDALRDATFTSATAVTLIRAVISSGLLLMALYWESRLLLAAGLSLSMVLDVLDGAVARARGVETVLGAQLDGVADRLAAALVLVGAFSLAPSPEAAIAAGIVWLQYGVVEQLLSGQFLRFGLWSPDHFYVESERVWWLNWSAPAKIVSGLPLGLMALGLWLPSLTIALGLIVLRTPCYAWIAAAARRIPEPHPLRAEEPAQVVPRLVTGRAAEQAVAEISHRTAA